jgi:hypothetical protein
MHSSVPRSVASVSELRALCGWIEIRYLGIELQYPMAKFENYTLEFLCRLDISNFEISALGRGGMRVATAHLGRRLSREGVEGAEGRDQL